MRVLVVKTSSLGDILHTLPALSDAKAQFQDIQFDWVVEEDVAGIPNWHPAVKNVIPIAQRRWRKNKMHAIFQGEILEFVQDLRKTSYDVIIDAQGLLKSVWIALLAKGKRKGYAWHSAREPWASLFYQTSFEIDWEKHAVERIRHLFAKALNYPLPSTPPNYGIAATHFDQIDQTNSVSSSSSNPSTQSPYFVFLQGTSWTTKLWPVQHWQALGQLLCQQGYEIKLLWGNEAEALRAKEIASKLSKAEVLGKQTLDQIAGLLIHAKGVVSLDTGLGHLAAALNVPTISLYGPTDPNRTGTYGLHQIHLQPDKQKFVCSPCFGKQCIRLKGDTPKGDTAPDNQNFMPPCLASLDPLDVMASCKLILN